MESRRLSSGVLNKNIRTLEANEEESSEKIIDKKAEIKKLEEKLKKL